MGRRHFKGSSALYLVKKINVYQRRLQPSSSICRAEPSLKIAILPSLVTQFARWPWHDFNLRLVRGKRKRKPRRAEERGRLSIVLSSLGLVGMGAFGGEMRPCCHPTEMNLIPNQRLPRRRHHQMNDIGGPRSLH